MYHTCRCNGKYKIHYLRDKPVIKYYEVKSEYPCYCSIEGMSGDQLAYAVQSSEFAAIIPCGGVEIRGEILLENNQYADDCLYVGLDIANTKKLMKHIHVQGNKSILYSEVQFEVKHSYFNNLHDALKNLLPVVIARLLPTAVDVRPLSKIPTVSQSIYGVLHLDTESPGPQVNAVQLISAMPNTNPPFLISGSFGTGKTRLLAAATHHFLEEGHHTQQGVRVLVCTHHQSSADTFINDYFGIMMHDAQYPWKEIVVRITPPKYYGRNPRFSSLYCTIEDFCSHFDDTRGGNVVVVTTFLSSLYFRSKIRIGFFTHILLDEAGQSREPEAVAPLCLANKETKIVMAGDKMQV